MLKMTWNMSCHVAVELFCWEKLRRPTTGCLYDLTYRCKSKFAFYPIAISWNQYHDVDFQKLSPQTCLWVRIAAVGGQVWCVKLADSFDVVRGKSPNRIPSVCAKCTYAGVIAWDACSWVEHAATKSLIWAMPYWVLPARLVFRGWLCKEFWGRGSDICFSILNWKSWRSASRNNT